MDIINSDNCTMQHCAINQRWARRLMLKKTHLGLLCDLHLVLPNCMPFSGGGSLCSIFKALNITELATLMNSTMTGDRVSCDFKQRP